MHRGQLHLLPVLGLSNKQARSPDRASPRDAPAKRSPRKGDAAGADGRERYLQLYDLAAQLAAKQEQARREK